jgi:hypothetical protein
MGPFRRSSMPGGAGRDPPAGQGCPAAWTHGRREAAQSHPPTRPPHSATRHPHPTTRHLHPTTRYPHPTTRAPSSNDSPPSSNDSPPSSNDSPPSSNDSCTCKSRQTPTAAPRPLHISIHSMLMCTRWLRAGEVCAVMQVGGPASSVISGLCRRPPPRPGPASSRMLERSSVTKRAVLSRLAIRTAHPALPRPSGWPVSSSVLRPERTAIHPTPATLRAVFGECSSRSWVTVSRQ